MAFQNFSVSEMLAQGQQQVQQLPHPTTTITVNGGDGGCNPSSDALCAMMMQSFFNNMRIPMRITAVVAGAYFSKAHGKGERGRTGKASGTPNENKKKPRWDAKKGKWWVPDENGKQKYLPGDFKPSEEDLKRAGLAMGGAAAAGAGAITLTEVLEGLAGAALAF
jgi:hypothetical protein